MKEKLLKYADLIIKGCLQFKAGFPIIISCSQYDKDFADILEKRAYELGASKVYVMMPSELKEKELLEKLTIDDIKKCEYFDKSLLDKVYKEKGSIIYLHSTIPTVLDGIDKEKIHVMNTVKKDTQGDAILGRRKYDFPWVIVGVSNEPWAKQIFPNDSNCVEKLWNLIFKCCLINTDDPVQAWNDKKIRSEEKTILLNELKLKTLKYKNSLGTDFSIDLPKDIIWKGTKEDSLDGTKELIVNMPSEEVFTSPDRTTANGIVYASKPLSLKGYIIDNIVLEVKEGVVTKVDASSNKNIIEETINEYEGMNQFGECALVDYSSPISETKVLFKNTLFDENAACHFALGDSFRTLLKDGITLTEEELIKKGLNQSKNHVDFMIGTNDLSIIGTDYEGNDVPIFVDGNFAKEEIKTFIKERKLKHEQI